MVPMSQGQSGQTFLSRDFESSIEVSTIRNPSMYLSRRKRSALPSRESWNLEKPSPLESGKSGGNPMPALPTFGRNRQRDPAPTTSTDEGSPARSALPSSGVSFE